jgi:acetyltransferase-like isoleucine patch superfamily enzyme
LVEQVNPFGGRSVDDARSARRFLGRAIRRLTLSRRLLRAYSMLYAGLHGIALGAGSIIHPGARLRVTGGGSISIGRNCEFLKGSIVETYGGDIRIGDHVSLNYYSILYGHGGLVIGHDVRIAAHVVVIPANHGIAEEELVRRQPLSRRGVTIEHDVWVAAGVRILDGVTIPTGCVIAAGAVVTPSLALEPKGIYGGVPARKISERSARAFSAEVEAGSAQKTRSSK